METGNIKKVIKSIYTKNMLLAIGVLMMIGTTAGNANACNINPLPPDLKFSIKNDFSKFIPKIKGNLFSCDSFVDVFPELGIGKHGKRPSHGRIIPSNPGEVEKPDVVNPVPEPATMLLLGTGLIGLASFNTRKRMSA